PGPPEACGWLAPRASPFSVEKKRKKDWGGPRKTLGNPPGSRPNFTEKKNPPVVDLFARHSPEGEAIGLRFNQSVQQIKALGLAHLAVKFSQGCIDGASHLKVGLEKRGNPAFDNLFLPFTFFQLFRLQFGARRKVAYSG